MADAIASYLRKRASLTGRPLLGPTPHDAVACVVVIPALAEYERLFKTLEALAASGSAVTSRTLVICVVNNRSHPDASAADIADNRDTLRMLEDWARSGHLAPLSLTWVDASTPGNELPVGEGVGLARKIGADHGLRLLAAYGRTKAPMVHLDADATPAPGYLDAVHGFYAAGPRWGAYADYRHPVDGPDTPALRAMVHYEIYMRYHELFLRWAGSPYAWPALGSIMSSTATAYAAAGGMKRRLAGEDFYFMQQLTKTGGVQPIPGACVYPSGRVSERTPFGTGQSVGTSATNDAQRHTLHHPDCYAVLKRWLALAREEHDPSGPALCEQASDIHPELGAFLDQRGFPVAWDRIRRENKEQNRRLRQFHVLFDGLRTIQLIHHLRDRAYPDTFETEAVTVLMGQMNTAPGTRIQMNPLKALKQLRAFCETTHQAKFPID